MAKKLHWTQRPENAERVRAQVGRAIAAKRSLQPGPSPLVNELQKLETQAGTRLKEIERTIHELNVEKALIIKFFPHLASETMNFENQEREAAHG